jgi:hypothetical protein
LSAQGRPECAAMRQCESIEFEVQSLFSFFSCVWASMRRFFVYLFRRTVRGGSNDVMNL